MLKEQPVCVQQNNGPGTNSINKCINFRWSANPKARYN